MPAPLPDAIEESPGDWLASQRVADLTGRDDVLAAVAERWDAWVAAEGLTILEGRGPTTEYPAITRTIDGDDVSIAVGLMGMTGQPWHVFVTVARHSARPRVEIRDGAIHSHGLAIPVMPGATPGIHMDYAALDGDDEHTVEVPGLTADAMTAFYRRWAASHGLSERAMDSERSAVVFHDSTRGVDVTITCHLPASVVICIGPSL